MITLPDFEPVPSELKVIIRECRNAAVAINCAFAWVETPEGQDFWEKVHNRLLEYANRPCDACGRG